MTGSLDLLGKDLLLLVALQRQFAGQAIDTLLLRLLHLFGQLLAGGHLLEALLVEVRLPGLQTDNVLVHRLQRMLHVRFVADKAAHLNGLQELLVGLQDVVKGCRLLHLLLQLHPVALDHLEEHIVLHLVDEVHDLRRKEVQAVRRLADL